MVAFIIWLLFFILVVTHANKLGRNPYIWALVSIITTPIIAGIVLLLLGKPND